VTGAQGWPNGSPRRKRTARIPTFKFEKPPGTVPRPFEKAGGMAGGATPAQGRKFLGVDVATHDERVAARWAGSSKISGKPELRLDTRLAGW